MMETFESRFYHLYTNIIKIPSGFLFVLLTDLFYQIFWDDAKRRSGWVNTSCHYKVTCAKINMWITSNMTLLFISCYTQNVFQNSKIIELIFFTFIWPVYMNIEPLYFLQESTTCHCFLSSHYFQTSLGYITSILLNFTSFVTTRTLFTVHIIVRDK